jgi:hypothetical protein
VYVYLDRETRQVDAIGIELGELGPQSPSLSAFAQLSAMPVPRLRPGLTSVTKGTTVRLSGPDWSEDVSRYQYLLLFAS